MKINIDCRFYSGNKPCQYHKLDKRLCENCEEYQKIEKRILIIKLDAMGDVLRTTSILPALARKYKNSEIVWITRKNALELIQNNPYIDKKLCVEENYLEFVLNEKFTAGINLDCDALSASILSLAGCTEKFGFLADESGRLFPVDDASRYWYLMGVNDQLKKDNRKTYKEIIYDICKIEPPVHKPQIVLSVASRLFAKNFHQRHQLSRFKKIVGLNTGGGNRWQLKKWTLANTIELIRLIKNSDEKIAVILFGGPEEIEFNQEIKQSVGHLLIDAGCHNSLLQFSALIDLSDIFVTPDSLGMHIGIALDKTTIVLVGPTSPWELDVFGNGEVLFSEHCDCVACYLPHCDKVKNCMSTLTPEKVFAALKKHL